METVSNVIQSAKMEPDTLSNDAGSTSAIVQSMETQISLNLQQEGEFSIQQDSVHVKAVSWDPAEATGGISFASVSKKPSGREPGQVPPGQSLSGTEVQTFTNTSQTPSDVLASVRLPANIIDLLQSSVGKWLFGNARSISCVLICVASSDYFGLRGSYVSLRFFNV